MSLKEITSIYWATLKGFFMNNNKFTEEALQAVTKASPATPVQDMYALLRMSRNDGSLTTAGLAKVQKVVNGLYKDAIDVLSQSDTDSWRKLHDTAVAMIGNSDEENEFIKQYCLMYFDLVEWMSKGQEV